MNLKKMAVQRDAKRAQRLDTRMQKRRYRSRSQAPEAAGKGRDLRRTPRRAYVRLARAITQVKKHGVGVLSDDLGRSGVARSATVLTSRTPIQQNRTGRGTPGVLRAPRFRRGIPSRDHIRRLGRGRVRVPAEIRIPRHGTFLVNYSRTIVLSLGNRMCFAHLTRMEVNHAFS